MGPAGATTQSGDDVSEADDVEIVEQVTTFSDRALDAIAGGPQSMLDIARTNAIREIDRKIATMTANGLIQDGGTSISWQCIATALFRKPEAT
jgi:hypothetical protein